MREICSYGSEGGGTETNQPSLPLFESRPFGPQSPSHKNAFSHDSNRIATARLVGLAMRLIPMFLMEMRRISPNPINSVGGGVRRH
jgi:hypothetical protein